jgi:methionyl-tRNA synthetase
VSVPLEDDPDARDKVLYVWFDAPIGYVSFTAVLCEREAGDWRRYERWWKDPECRVVHFIGEDNIVFHALVWPAMLMAEGSYALPRQVVANSFLNVRFPGGQEAKIGKSAGNAIWIEEYLKRFDPDPLRYYLTAVAPETRRTTFEVEDFVARNNGELLAALGNLVNRTLTFAQRYCDGAVPDAGRRDAADGEQLAAIGRCAERTTAHLEGLRFRAALGEVMALARAANGYLDVKRPWQQRREDEAACGTTINVCLQTVRGLTVLMAPFLPFSAQACLQMLRLPAEALSWHRATEELPVGHRLGEPKILYRKLELAELVPDPPQGEA